MMMMVPVLPVSHPTPSVSGNERPDRASTSAVPNCAVNTGAGSVTCGICTPNESTNRMLISVTTTLTEPARTKSVSGTLNGGTDGQNVVVVRWADSVEGMTLNEADSTLGVVGVPTLITVPSQAAARSAPRTSIGASLRVRTGNLRPHDDAKKRPNRARIASAVHPRQWRNGGDV